MEQCDREEGKKERGRRRRRKSVRFFPAAKLQLNIEKSDGADRRLRQNSAGLSNTDQSQLFTAETNIINSRSTYSLVLQLLTVSSGLHQLFKLSVGSGLLVHVCLKSKLLCKEKSLKCLCAIKL